MSQYISVLVEEGEGRTDIISKGFDYERWVKTQTQSRRGEHKLLSKDNIVTQLVTFIEDKLIQWCLNADVELMCEQSHKQLLQMRVCVLKRNREGRDTEEQRERERERVTDRQRWID